MQSVEYHHFSPGTVNSKKSVASRHKRSKSDPHKRVEEGDLGHWPISFQGMKLDVRPENGQTSVKKESSLEADVRSSLEKEILQLEKKLKDQFEVRSALEMALGHRSSSIDTPDDRRMPKPTRELIREIAVLEVEVMYFEQHLLSLYRKAFDQQVSTSSPPIMQRSKLRIGCQSKLIQEVPVYDITPDKRNLANQSSETLSSWKSTTKQLNETGFSRCPEKLTGPDVNRSHSALSLRSVCSGRLSPQAESLAKALRSCHSQPLSFLEHGQDGTSEVISLAEYLGTRISDHVPETPNKFSEDLIKCMGSIYCKLVDCPLVYLGLSSSPTSSFSSTSAFSPQYLGDMWSPSCRKDSSRGARLENPFRVQGLKEFSGPYNAMIEVPSISRENLKLSEVEDMLQSYKTLCRRLESVDPRKMKNQEKLAFWVNIHNALVMQAYLEYGIPQNNLKRGSLLLKAACNIGGRTINAYTIQSFILRCRTHLPGKWLRAMLSPRLKFKAGDDWQAYAVEHPEPLLHFALCSGIYSDPAVRIYTSKRVFQELEVAKEEYLRAAVSIHKEQKILLPKIIESFAKDSSMSVAGMVDMIEQYLPETLQMVMQRCQQGRSQKSIEWVPHNLGFRYLLARELIDPQMN